MAEHQEPSEQPARESAAVGEHAAELTGDQLEDVAGGTRSTPAASPTWTTGRLLGGGSSINGE